MDGLLLNTELVYSKVSDEILKSYGLPLFTWDLKKRMIGLREDEACKLFVEETNIPMTADAYRVLRTKMQNESFPSCRPLPGVMKLITYLKDRGVPVCVYVL
jgi:beta-phosphoglucomutase-like phosphatase (HAD superfamily)